MGEVRFRRWAYLLAVVPRMLSQTNRGRACENRRKLKAERRIRAVRAEVWKGFMLDVDRLCWETTTTEEGKNLQSCRSFIGR